MTSTSGEAAPEGARFGTCCSELAEAIAAQGFDPLVTVADNGVLYLTVGLLDTDDPEGGAALVDHPMFFCPFCGTKLQTAEEVKQKITASGG